MVINDFQIWLLFIQSFFDFNLGQTFDVFFLQIEPHVNAGSKHAGQRLRHFPRQIDLPVHQFAQCLGRGAETGREIILGDSFVIDDLLDEVPRVKCT